MAVRQRIRQATEVEGGTSNGAIEETVDADRELVIATDVLYQELLKRRRAYAKANGIPLKAPSIQRGSGSIFFGILKDFSSVADIPEASMAALLEALGTPVDQYWSKDAASLDARRDDRFDRQVPLSRLDRDTEKELESLSSFDEHVQALLEEAERLYQQSADENMIHMGSKETFPLEQQVIALAAELLLESGGNPHVRDYIGATVFGGTLMSDRIAAQNKRQYVCYPDFFWEHVAGILAAKATMGNR